MIDLERQLTMTTHTPSQRRSIHSPGSPSDLKQPKAATNPDGKTPAELPAGKPTSLHDAKPAGGDTAHSEEPKKSNHVDKES